MDETTPHLSNDPDHERGPFRKYGWVLAVLGVTLLGLGAAVGLSMASGPGLPFLGRLNGGSGGPAPTLLPAQTDTPSATASLPITLTSQPSLPPADTPTSTVTATATRSPGVALTCRCQGTDYVCSDGSATYNSPRCAPAVTPTCSCQGADYVCSDGTRSTNDIRCGLVCACQGNNLVCNDGTVALYNPQCACTCDGTTLVCNDGGREANSALCKKKKNK